LSSPVRCRREIVLDRRRDLVVVRDTLESAGTHRYCWRFHFDPALAVAVQDDAVAVSANGLAAWLLPDAPVSLTIEDAWVSPSYGVKQPARRAVYQTEVRGPIVRNWMFSTAAMPARDRLRHVDELFERATKQPAAVH
jgi:hypothetical protein